MTGLVNVLNELEEYKKIIDVLSQGDVPIHIIGEAESGRAHLIYSISQSLNKKILVVLNSELQAKRMNEDLGFFTRDFVHIPAKETVLYNVEASSTEAEHEKMLALSQLESSSGAVMSIETLLQFVTPKNVFEEYNKTIRLGETVELERLLADLVAMGYTRVDLVEGIGQFSVRGGIIDIYAPTLEYPVRMEFFDDEVDSIRTFDPMTQLSIEKIEEVRFIPAGEMTAEGSILTYFPKEWMIVLDEPQRIAERAQAIEWEIEETVKGLLEKGAITEVKPRYINSYADTVRRIEAHAVVSLSTLSHATPDFKPKHFFELTTKTLQSYGGKLEFLIDDLVYWRERKYRIIILAGSKGRADNLIAALEGKRLEATYYDELFLLPPRGTIAVTHGSLSKGIEYPLINTVIVSDREIFPGEKKKRKYKAVDNAAKIKDYTELNPGDYVVHTVHGIGKYIGLEHMEVAGQTKDCLKIKYKGEDYLYVPVSQLDMIHKYRSGVENDNAKLKLSKLGGSEWKNTKENVKKSCLELAKKLVELYAQRQQLQGHAFGKDTEWQRQFEDEFIYEETPDQLRSIEEVKKDMESSQPMDRLLCGDVGFGKTEVAIRAAFKCVSDGMQVAYLVPTTILASQQYNNFAQRMQKYPIKVAMMSRFRTAKEQKETAQQVKSGEVDILIGTHRILQKDINFKNLGLLIIDEEQRFGVEHKETIKQLKKNVDVLTLSATPIPRSLHMSMIGIRDMSILSQPPEDRHPVQTFVMEYNEAVIADAITREIDRGGQVFYLFNRVQGIYRVAERLRALVPEARIEVAHGKMNEGQLENVMMQVLEDEVDVLVCTTIIETGLDIANANTIIIENADRMGLAQLYQLRGRVGRSSRRAYAYLTYRKDKVLDEKAEKRLRAIKEFTEFGSGFKIALRDLELRGAGNVLGPEQHGFMDTVGYDVYCDILSQAVREIKGEPEKIKVVATVDLGVNAFIPEKYIPSPKQRIELYKKIAGLEDLSGKYAIEEELEDRFGDPPQPVRRLIDVAYIKALASSLGISEISEAHGSILLYIHPNFLMGLMPSISELISKNKGKILLNAGSKPYISFRKIEKKEEKVLDFIKNLLKDLKVSE